MGEDPKVQAATAEGVSSATKSDTHATPTAAAPSWKELQEFISKQTDRDRDLIDKWFKLACAIIAAVFAVGEYRYRVRWMEDHQ
jgi:hypothetical protein